MDFKEAEEATAEGQAVQEVRSPVAEFSKIWWRAMQICWFINNPLPDLDIVASSASIRQTLSQTHQVQSTWAFLTPRSLMQCHHRRTIL
jgi:hypothetical protein